MKKITIVLFLFTTIFSSIAQNRDGSLFYTTVEKTDSIYKANIDIYEVGKIEYIEIQLVDEDKNELASDMAQLINREGKYLLSFKDKETPVYPENIDLTLKNEYNNIKYPQINIKLYDSSLRILDYSQTVFY
ncbi:hypothetical protein ACOSP6_01910 [Tenacibaculum sp. MEBiC06402]|uniref:hypothetical protein n=1 Tax=unclassified Tenacibaculum TaxID=2635139 RepID=UPI003B9B9701